jgi:hypothetical protein
MMKPNQYSAVKWLSAAALGLALTACGSGAVGGAAVTGVALTDGPVLGTVSINDSSAAVQSRTVSTASDGGFSVDLEGLTPPYLIKLEWHDAAGTNRLFAVSEGSENLDVNPITDLAFDDAAGTRDPAVVFSESTSDDHHGTATRARDLLARLSKVLAPLFERYGITDLRTDKAAVRALLADVSVKRENGLVTVTNKATGGVIYTGPLSDLASGTFTAANMPAGPGQPPPASTCTSFTYSAYGTCMPNGMQSRTVLTSTPTGCTGGAPATTLACTYVPPTPITCTSFTYSAYGACMPNGMQSRTVLTSTPTGCTGGAPATTLACTYVPPTTIDGAALYTQYCSGCHGNGKKGSASSAIQNAIDTNRGNMGTTALKALTPAQIAAIAAAP